MREKLEAALEAASQFTTMQWAIGALVCWYFVVLPIIVRLDRKELVRGSLVVACTAAGTIALASVMDAAVLRAVSDAERWPTARWVQFFGLTWGGALVSTLVTGVDFRDGLDMNDLFRAFVAYRALHVAVGFAVLLGAGGFFFGGLWGAVSLMLGLVGAFVASAAVFVYMGPREG